MLSLSTTNRVTFNVNVFGTASTPTVRCVVGEAPGYSFQAVKTSGGEYEVLIDLPKDLRLGTYPFKVEVLLNGRLFTPINHNVPVTGPEPAEAPPPNEVPAVTAPAEVVEPVEPRASLLRTFTPASETVVPPVAKPAAPKPSAKIAETPKAAPVKIETPPAKFTDLGKLAKTPVFGSLPKVEIKQVKISMSEIAAAAEKMEPKAPRKAKAQPKTVSESISPSVPVSIIKGTIVYR